MTNAGGQESQISVTSTISANLAGRGGPGNYQQAPAAAPLPQEDFGDEISILNSYVGNNIGGPNNNNQGVGQYGA